MSCRGLVSLFYKRAQGNVRGLPKRSSSELRAPAAPCWLGFGPEYLRNVRP